LAFVLEGRIFLLNLKLLSRMHNGTMLQYFHWYIPSDGNFWKQVASHAEPLAKLGFNSLWLPPAYKGISGSESNGYDVYDLFDLGEFDQKGSVRTKFGTKEEYIHAVKSLHDRNIQVYADIVLNHKGGADEKERIKVIRVDPENRNQFIGEPLEIDAYTKFSFPGRRGKYSEFVWNYLCFSGLDYADDLKENSIFSILNEYGNEWEEVVDTEKGNYDYLMLDDIDFRNPAVREELIRWGKWYMDQVPFDGVRLDAVKHMSPRFYNEWLDCMRDVKPDLFAVGEYWAPRELPLMLKYIEKTNGRMCLFDAPLHQNFHLASKQGKDYNLAAVFENSLVNVRPDLAVTVVDNHDTQPLQALEAPVESWFKPLGYALILLREQGYPCVFYPDIYGAHYIDKGGDGIDHEIFLEKTKHIEELLKARKEFAYGLQRDYLNHPNCIGWTREGSDEFSNSGCAVLMSNGEECFKEMEIGKKHRNKTFIDLLNNHPARIEINEEGWGKFFAAPGSVSVWIDSNAAIRT
jgi:alpha-amylase